MGKDDDSDKESVPAKSPSDFDDLEAGGEGLSRKERNKLKKEAKKARKEDKKGKDKKVNSDDEGSNSDSDEDPLVTEGKRRLKGFFRKAKKKVEDVGESLAGSAMAKLNHEMKELSVDIMHKAGHAIQKKFDGFLSHMAHFVKTAVHKLGDRMEKGIVKGTFKKFPLSLFKPCHGCLWGSMGHKVKEDIVAKVDGVVDKLKGEMPNVNVLIDKYLEKQGLGDAVKKAREEERLLAAGVKAE